MVKRPSLSANLYTSAKHDATKRPPETIGPMAAYAASEKTVFGNASRSTVVASEDKPVVSEDRLMDIVGQAVSGLSVASYVTWHQSLLFQTRLSSYLLQLAKISQGSGRPYGFNFSDTKRPDRDG